MKKLTFILLSFTVFLGCATSKMSVLVDNFTPSEKKIVFLSGENALKQLRIELQNLGFTVPRYASLYAASSSEEKDTQHGKEVVKTPIRSADARYGIEALDSEVLDYSILSSARKWSFTLEVIDLEKNEVIAYIEEIGWEHPLGEIYKKVAQRINDLWEGRVSKNDTNENKSK